MSNLNDTEKIFIRDFLRVMNDDSVQALASTVTRKMLKTDTRTACEDAIILHTTSIDEFLKRQKVTKENLFKYLNERKISVPNTDKAALEMQIKQLLNKGNGSGSHIVQRPAKQHSGPGPSSSWTASEFNCNSNPTPMPNQQQFNDYQMPGAAQLYLAAASATRITVQERVTTATYTNMSAASLAMNLPEPQATAITNEFVKWFYTRANQPSGILPEDFWPDANIKLTVKRKSDCNPESKQGQGGRLVAELFNNTLEEHQLYLNPNVSPQGLWGRGNDLGLLLVLVCGTLHHRPSANHRSPNVLDIGPCLGTFENLFLLAQGPKPADNWKIKTLEIILHSNLHVQQMPTLNESELAKSVIQQF